MLVGNTQNTSNMVVDNPFKRGITTPASDQRKTCSAEQVWIATGSVEHVSCWPQPVRRHVRKFEALPIHRRRFNLTGKMFHQPPGVPITDRLADPFHGRLETWAARLPAKFLSKLREDGFCLRNQLLSAIECFLATTLVLLAKHSSAKQHTAAPVLGRKLPNAWTPSPSMATPVAKQVVQSDTLRLEEIRPDLLRREEISRLEGGRSLQTVLGINISTKRNAETIDRVFVRGAEQQIPKRVWLISGDDRAEYRRAIDTTEVDRAWPFGWR
jgi:hypothetical protein